MVCLSVISWPSSALGIDYSEHTLWSRFILPAKRQADCPNSRLFSLTQLLTGDLRELRNFSNLRFIVWLRIEPLSLEYPV